MNIAFWPIDIPQRPAPGRVSGATADVRATFEPDVGAPITRPRATSAPQIFNIGLVPMTKAQYATFETWVESDLANGSNRFVWRHPITRAVRYFKLMAGEGIYQSEPFEPHDVTVSFSMMMLPGLPWFAPYVPACTSRVPAFVADYDGGIYGVEGAPVAASALPDIGGEYLVKRTTTTAVTEGVQTLTAGDIPETAPADTLSIVGFDL